MLVVIFLLWKLTYLSTTLVGKVMQLVVSVCPPNYNLHLLSRRQSWLQQLDTVLVGRQEEHPACKNWVMRHWRYLSGARCRLFAYGPADATVVQTPHHLFPHLNPGWFYLFIIIIITILHGLQEVSCPSGAVKIPDPAENIELFIFCPAPRGTVMRCRVTRDKKGIDRNMYPTYYLHLEHSNGKRVSFLYDTIRYEMLF